MALFSISEMKAKDVMKSSFKTIDVNEPVSKALNAIDKDGIFNVLVFENGKYAGYFGYKQLVKIHSNMSEATKITGLFARGPVANEDTPFIDLVTMMYRNDAKIIPILSSDKVIGVVETTDIIKNMPKIRDIRTLSVRDVMTPDPISLREEENIGSALSVFRQQGIVRVPVVNGQHIVLGIVESHDLAKELRTKPEYGIDMFFGGGVGSVKTGALTNNDTVSTRDVGIKGLMKTSFVKAFPDDLISIKVPLLFDGVKTTTIVVVDEEDRLLGIVAPKDILHHIAQKRVEKGLLIQSSGIEREESLTDFQKDKVAKIMEETVNRIQEVSEIQSFSVHLKTTKHTHGKQHQYHLFCKAVTDDGVFTSRETEWDFVLAAGNSLKEVESQILHKIAKKKDIAKMRALDGKKSTMI